MNWKKALAKALRNFVIHTTLGIWILATVIGTLIALYSIAIAGAWFALGNIGNVIVWAILSYLGASVAGGGLILAKDIYEKYRKEGE